MNIKIGGLYCISDAYFEKFHECQWVLHNHIKERSDGMGYRPHVIVMRDAKNKDILWAVPLAHDIKKYQTIYDQKVTKHGSCGNIDFVKILHNPTSSAALAQNMIPVIIKYIEKPYSFSNRTPKKLSGHDIKKVISMARRTLKKHFHGRGAIFPPVDSIYQSLNKELTIARGVKALKAHPLISNYIFIKETNSMKTTVFILGGEQDALEDICLVKIDESLDDKQTDQQPHWDKITITDSRFADKVKDLSDIQWTKNEVLPTLSPTKTNRDGFMDALDRAEKSCQESTICQATERGEKAKADQSKSTENQR